MGVFRGRVVFLVGGFPGAPEGRIRFSSGGGGDGEKSDNGESKEDFIHFWSLIESIVSLGFYGEFIDGREKYSEICQQFYIPKYLFLLKDKILFQLNQMS